MSSSFALFRLQVWRDNLLEGGSFLGTIHLWSFLSTVFGIYFTLVFAHPHHYSLHLSHRTFILALSVLDRLFYEIFRSVATCLPNFQNFLHFLSVIFILMPQHLTIFLLFITAADHVHHAVDLLRKSINLVGDRHFVFILYLCNKLFHLFLCTVVAMWGSLGRLAIKSKTAVEQRYRLLRIIGQRIDRFWEMVHYSKIGGFR